MTHMVFGLSRNKTADAVSQVLEEREIAPIVAISVSTAGGVVVADVIANRVLPMVGISADPSTLVDAIASAGLKGVMALALGVAAAEMTGIPQLAIVFGAVGVLTSAGADLLTVLFDLPQVAQVRRQISSGNTTTPSNTGGGAKRAVAHQSTPRNGTRSGGGPSGARPTA